MIVLDYRDRSPLYEQVVEKFEELMFNGALEENSQLPSVRSLAADLAINPNTIQRAYAELERQGYIYSIKGKGSFVADRSRVRQGMMSEWQKQFDAAVDEGLRIGVGADEMAGRLRARLEMKMREEGIADDRGGKPDKTL